MSKPYLNYKTVLEVTEKIVGASPKKVYHQGTHGCKYVHKSGPSCLVAQVFSELGVPTEKLAEWDGLGIIGSVFARGLVPFRVSPKVSGFLWALQYHQDSGKQWGQALKFAKQSA